MIIPPVGPFVPVAPVSPVKPVAARKAKGVDKSSGDRLALTRPSRSAAAIASHSTRAALDEMKLGG